MFEIRRPGASRHGIAPRIRVYDARVDKRARFALQRERYAAQRPKPGTRFNRWTLVRYLAPEERPDPKLMMVIALCDCGTVRKVNWSNLHRGVTHSCGCSLRKEPWSKAKVLAEMRRRQGRTKRPLRIVDFGGGFYQKIRGAFGGINAARAVAGVPRLRRWWSFDSVIQEFRRLRRQGVEPTVTRLQELGRWDLIRASYKHVGSFRLATLAASTPRRAARR